MKLSKIEIQKIISDYPYLPEDYLYFIKNKEIGELENGHSIYGGPIKPEEIYGHKLRGSKIILFGDDGMGYCFGYDTEKHNYGELTPRGEWESSDETFDDYTK